jgi:hypothetical protein
MTLIITLVRPREIAVVSDRRVTVDGKLLEDEDDEHTKLIEFSCEDADATVAFTGLARWDAFATRQWLRELLSTRTSSCRLAAVIQDVRRIASEKIRGMPTRTREDRRLTILFAGFRSDETPVRPFSCSITNWETTAMTSDEFRIVWGPPPGRGIVTFAGSTDSVTAASRALLVDLAGNPDGQCGNLHGRCDTPDS